MNDQTLTVERVLIALLSVLALGSAIGIGLSFAMITAQTGASVFDLFSAGFLMGPVKGSVYWLAAVGGLWFMAHRLNMRHWWVLMVIGAAVSAGMTLVFSGSYFSLFWLLANIVISAFLGWVLWRLAYRGSVSGGGAASRPILGPYETTIVRVFAALLTGSVAGFCATMGIVMVIFGRMGPADFVDTAGLAAPVWLGGVFVLGGVSLAVLHALGIRQWYGMTIVGGLIMMVLGMVLFNDAVEIWITLTMTATGLLVGWVIWRVAYRRGALEAVV